MRQRSTPSDRGRYAASTPLRGRCDLRGGRVVLRPRQSRLAGVGDTPSNARELASSATRPTHRYLTNRGTLVHEAVSGRFPTRGNIREHYPLFSSRPTRLTVWGCRVLPSALFCLTRGAALLQVLYSDVKSAVYTAEPLWC